MTNEFLKSFDDMTLESIVDESLSCDGVEDAFDDEWMSLRGKVSRADWRAFLLAHGVNPAGDRKLLNRAVILNDQARDWAERGRRDMIRKRRTIEYFQKAHRACLDKRAELTRNYHEALSVCDLRRADELSASIDELDWLRDYWLNRIFPDWPVPPRKVGIPIRKEIYH